jgi:hypothetical protein
MQRNLFFYCGGTTLSNLGHTSPAFLGRKKAQVPPAKRGVSFALRSALTGISFFAPKTERIVPLIAIHVNMPELLFDYQNIQLRVEETRWEIQFRISYRCVAP